METEVEGSGDEGVVEERRKEAREWMARWDVNIIAEMGDDGSGDGGGDRGGGRGLAGVVVMLEVREVVVVVVEEVKEERKVTSPAGSGVVTSGGI